MLIKAGRIWLTTWKTCSRISENNIKLFLVKYLSADARCPRVDGDGVCSAAVSAARAGQPPQFAPREQAQEDRHANGGADPESVCGHLADDHQAYSRRGHSTSAHTLVRLPGRHPPTAGLGGYSLWAT